jgi:hypothetical protein
MSIIISQKGKASQKIEKSNFDKEDYLQNYIHENPESIPVYEIEEDKKLFVVAREFSTESGPIDALAIDKDGDIYVVETKLYKNPDKRTVVAQALDYGASLWRHSDYNQFISRIEKEVESKFKINLNDKLKYFFSIDEDQVLFLLDSLKDNLQNGNIKFVILMDAIAERLKDLIIYINQNSQFDIYAVSMEYYKFDKYEIMIPKLFGVEVKKNVSSSVAGQRKAWDENSFISQVKEKLGTESNKLIAVYEMFKKNSDNIKWGTGNLNASFSPIINSMSNSISPFTLYSNGLFLIKFSWLKKHGDPTSFDKYFNIFIDEISKTNLKITKEELLKDSVRISSEDFFSNYDVIFGILGKIKKY